MKVKEPQAEQTAECKGPDNGSLPSMFWKVEEGCIIIEYNRKATGKYMMS